MQLRYWNTSSFMENKSVLNNFECSFSFEFIVFTASKCDLWMYIINLTAQNFNLNDWKLY